MSTSTTIPTFRHHELAGGLRLGLNRNQKLKTTDVRVTFVADLAEATVTPLALLPMVQARGTAGFPDMQAIGRRLDDLYGASVTGYVQKVGEWQLIRFVLRLVNERFLPGGSSPSTSNGGLFRDGLEFLREFILAPVTESSAFRSDYVAQEKENLRLTIDSLLDHKAAYAEQRLIETLCPNEPYRLHEHGRTEDIPVIEPAELLAQHGRLTQAQPAYVYVTGDVDLATTQALIEDVFGPQHWPRAEVAEASPPPVPTKVDEYREATETMDVQQARLALGFRHGITRGHALYMASLLMNGVLGGFSHSRLFHSIREKESMAYSVHSTLDRTKGLMFVTGGVDPTTCERVKEMMISEVDAMKRGDFTDEEVDDTRAALLNQNRMLEDNLPGLADTDMIWRLHGIELDLEKFREDVLKVTRDEIVAAAECLEHGATFQLSREAGAAET